MLAEEVAVGVADVEVVADGVGARVEVVVVGVGGADVAREELGVAGRASPVDGESAGDDVVGNEVALPDGEARGAEAHDDSRRATDTTAKGRVRRIHSV